MVRKFSPEDIISQNLVKSSVQRNLKLNIVKQYPILKDTIDAIFPKKSQVYTAKCQEHITLIIVCGEIVFFQQRDGPWIPSLRLIHKYPPLLPKMQIDSGAIKFILRGSNIMCPGLTSPDGYMDEVEANTVVQITANGRVHACAIGITAMSTQEIRDKNRDVGVETLHHLNDGIWHYDASKL
ncbi:cell cycle regulator protein, putative [Theileria equi strain WA]|uniref:Cell cycle regulator protein, putative n=1 Tax=Theileria equi strain WA TaxID=1537102 RepID=L0AYM7_THEEQ|nr:cell cycle regulator protein, putative [Theileria equi strain WA]AFZ80697.1 cell cycle regulator protein, putative [Theileria equi strain WA]|eukprot:XP_004830363.1 cell cycle regulator protein, putative [Theileria equi strain WA]